MYYLYIDESGDTGHINSPTNYFVLTGLVIHETNWRTFLDDLVRFRQNLRGVYGLKLKEEIHAMPFVQKSHPMPGMAKNIKIYILRQCIDWMAARSDVQILTVAVDKRGKPATYNVFENAWQALIQRFENTIQHRNYPGGFADQRGMLVPDGTYSKQLTGLVRKMRHYNTVPNTAYFAQQGTQYRNMKLQYVIEDPFFKDSAGSFIHQMVDVMVYFARQYFEPNTRVKKTGARTFYARLMPVINPHTTKGHPLHIKML
jgi:hypothetical protein